MIENDLLYTLALQHVPNIGDITAKRLISHCGSAESVLKEKKQNLLKIDGIGSITISDLFKTHHLKEAEKELAFIEANNIKVSYFQGDNYPEKLKHCIDGPILLFQTGNIDLKKQHIISIVGARKIGANKYGLHQVAYASYEGRLDALKALRNIKRTHNRDAWLLVQKLD